MPNKKHLILLLLFCYALGTHAQVTFVITSIPKTTPNTDTVFITGSFNNWRVNDPAYMLNKQLDGTLSITLPIDSTTEYKFTRGSWMKVETNAQNFYIANRIYSGKGNETVHLEIVNWLDMGGVKGFDYMLFYYFVVAILGLILIFFGYRFTKSATHKYQAFAFFNSLISIIFFGVVAYDLGTSVLQAYLAFFVKVFLFIWGPGVYLFVHGFLKDNRPPSLPLHFIPLLLASGIAIFSMINFERFSFLSSYIWFPLTYESVVMLGSGIIFNLTYFIWLFQSTNTKNGVKRTSETIFAKQFIIFNLMTLFTLPVNLLLLHSGVFTKFVADYKMFFVTFSGVIFLETFIVWKHPEFFREKPHQFHLEFPPELKNKICQIMDDKKPFKDPDLNIDLLAEMLETKPHILSKLLNEHFNKNFRDFVNGYRIEEFIKLAKKGRLESYTYLALAHEVGFNSKSTFNLAFKKITKQNPRTYFKSHRVTSQTL